MLQSKPAHLRTSHLQRISSICAGLQLQHWQSGARILRFTNDEATRWPGKQIRTIEPNPNLNGSCGKSGLLHKCRSDWFDPKKKLAPRMLNSGRLRHRTGCSVRSRHADCLSCMFKIEEQSLIRECITHAPVELSTKPFCFGFPGAMKCWFKTVSLHHQAWHCR